jgi:hypothetical protein
VKLLIHHPNLPACATCQKFMVDYDWLYGGGTGEIKTFGDPKNPQKLERAKDNPPPCGSCPKKGPQHEREFLLSEKNCRALQFYRQTKATFGRGLTKREANDAIVRRNFSILDGLFAGAEREGLSNAISVAIGKWFPRAG